MKLFWPILLATIFTGCGSSNAAEPPTDAERIAQQASVQDAAANSVDQSLGEYPRERDLDGNHLLIHAPQVRSWENFERFEAWLAIEFTPAETGEVEYATAHISGATKVDLDERLVRITHPVIDDVQFADRGVEDTSAWEDVVKNAVVRQQLDVPLDLFLVYLAEGVIEPAPTQGLNPEPPEIVISTEPALLLFIDGAPVWAPIEETGVELLANANWPVLRSDDALYLLHDEQWLTATATAGPWAQTQTLPESFDRIPAAAPFEAIHAALPPPATPGPAPSVIVRSKPTELIVMGGEPELVEISGAQGLRYVANTASILFRLADRWFYLASGRWFSSDDLAGPWNLENVLPEAFQLIPSDHALANVRASVPGTIEARLALLEAALPRETTVPLDAKPDVEVSYAGEPEFEPVGTSGVQRVRNSGYDVFLFEGRYYWCHGGVWYLSAGATGPWSPATQVPAALYEIPPNSPGYNNTYVMVTNTTSSSVTYVYTSGYTNVYFGYGTTYYGSGWYYPPYIYGGYYYPYYRSYGYGSWYNPNTGRYMSRSVAYGPYGGYSYTSGYNPRTGRYGYSEAAWDGDEWASHGETYNPRTGVYSHTDRYYDDDRDMAHTERSFQRGDDWMTVDRRIDTKHNTVEVSRETSRGGSVDAYRDFDGEGGMSGSSTITTGDGRTITTEGNFERGEGSVDLSGSGGGSGTITRDIGSSGITRDGEFTKDGETLSTSTQRHGDTTRTGFETSSGGQGVSVSQGLGRITVAQDSSGDLYAGHNGTVYKKTDDGWQHRENGEWQQTQAPERQLESPSATRRNSQVADYSKQLEAATAPRGNYDRAASAQWSGGSWGGSQLDRHYQARQTGNSRYQQRRSADNRGSFGGARRAGGRGGRRR